MPNPTPAQVRELMALRKGATPGRWTMTQPSMGFAEINDENGNLIFAIAYPSLGLGDKARPEAGVEANAALLIPVDEQVLESWLRMEAALRGMPCECSFECDKPGHEGLLFSKDWCVVCTDETKTRKVLCARCAALAGEAQEVKDGE